VIRFFFPTLWLAHAALAQTNYPLPYIHVPQPTVVTPADPYGVVSQRVTRPAPRPLPPTPQEMLRRGFVQPPAPLLPPPPAPLPLSPTVPKPTLASNALTKTILFNTPEADAILSKLQVFPPDNPWNTDISTWPRHPMSQDIIASMGANAPFRCNRDMGFILIPPDQPRVPVTVTPYFEESDKGPYPVPDNVPIEGWPLYPAKATLDEVQRDTRDLGGDRHAIIVDPANRMLYEFFAMKKLYNGWQAVQASIFDLKHNKLRPDGWTSADAAGLPIFPAVVRYDDIQRGIVAHAMRVTARKTRRAYVAPATHHASRLTDQRLPRMGERFRLKHEFDISSFSVEAQAVLKGLKRYGMFVADNGIDWAISIAPDTRIRELDDDFRRVRGSDFEVVVAP
jgi:hypothetical protein